VACGDETAEKTEDTGTSCNLFTGEGCEDTSADTTADTSTDTGTADTTEDDTNVEDTEVDTAVEDTTVDTGVDTGGLQESCGNGTDDESPWGRRKKPPGLLQSVCAQLFNKSTGQKQQTVSISNQDDDPCSKNQAVEEDSLSDISNGLDDSSTNELVDAAFGDSGNSVPLPANPPELPLLTTLGLDLSIECIPRYQNKPKSMYTFICAQDFRRDEFAWHYRNWVM
jgi:hypothetical protein